MQDVAQRAKFDLGLQAVHRTWEAAASLHAGTLQFMTRVVAASRGKELAKEDLKTAEEGGEGEMGESSDGHRKPGS